MKKEIICVYQDCPLCGDRGRVLKKLIFNKNLNVRKVSFASEEGKELIHKAVFECGIGTMPFFTDGIRFSEDINEFIDSKTKKSHKKKGVENGLDK